MHVLLACFLLYYLYLYKPLLLALLFSSFLGLHIYNSIFPGRVTACVVIIFSPALPVYYTHCPRMPFAALFCTNLNPTHVGFQLVHARILLYYPRSCMFSTHPSLSPSSLPAFPLYMCVMSHISRSSKSSTHSSAARHAVSHPLFLTFSPIRRLGSRVPGEQYRPCPATTHDLPFTYPTHTTYIPSTVLCPYPRPACAFTTQCSPPILQQSPTVY